MYILYGTVRYGTVPVTVTVTVTAGADQLDARMAGFADKTRQDKNRMEWECDGG